MSQATDSDPERLSHKIHNLESIVLFVSGFKVVFVYMDLSRPNRPHDGYTLDVYLGRIDGRFAGRQLEASLVEPCPALVCLIVALILVISINPCSW
jgi:cytochrome b subunit of formate dehydrogenase